MMPVGPNLRSLATQGSGHEFGDDFAWRLLAEENIVHALAKPRVLRRDTLRARAPRAGAASGGRRDYAGPLALAAAAAGIDALFIETHPAPTTRSATPDARSPSPTCPNY